MADGNPSPLQTGLTPGLVPVPDPTTLTNTLVATAVKALDDRITARMDGTDKYIDERFKALTESLAIFKIAVDERFKLGDVQTEKAARDVKSAVDAAFAAAKEAVGEQNKSNALSIAKSEVSTTKQIDQLNDNLRLSVKNSDDKFNDLKERVVAIESRTGGHNDSFAWMIAIVSVAAALALVVVDLLHK
jgi:hypothetical protein